MFTDKRYDYLVVGAGLFGATFARLMTDAGKRVLVYEKSNHIGGHCHTKDINGIMVHVYGPHAFHTNNREVWNFVNKFGEFNQRKPKVLAQYKEKLYSLPFNMMTFYQLWGCKSPKEAMQKIESQRVKIENPKNLEEAALSTVGKDIYEMLIKGYTAKQWGRPCKFLPASIIKRIPLRFSYDDCYWSNARWAGIPIKGYTALMENMLQGIDVELNTDYDDENIGQFAKIAKKMVYTGPIDKLFHYKHGTLEYRTLEFKTIEAEDEDFQGVLQINYTEEDVPFTRVVEHKHFYDNPEQHKKTIVTFEYPATWTQGSEPYYPINDEKNTKTFAKYTEELSGYKNITVTGRLGSYKYIDMDQTVAMAMETVKKELQ